MATRFASVDAVAVPKRNWVARLQQFVATPLERCELCGQLVHSEHEHMLDMERGQPVCACLGCATVLGSRSGGRFRAVPPRAARLSDFEMTDAEWNALQIPIGMAFLLNSSVRGMVALYPGPAGVTQSIVRPEAWATIAANNAEIADMAQDIEALLVNRVKGRRETYRVSIDRCFVLVALFRKHWRGFTGGDAVWAVVDDFFERLNDSRAVLKGWAHG